MKVKIYTRAGCPYCDMTKNLLKYFEVEFENIEISRDFEKQKELQEISGQCTTPVLVCDDKIFIGFDREKIKEALGINKEQKSL